MNPLRNILYCTKTGQNESLTLHFVFYRRKHPEKLKIYINRVLLTSLTNIFEAILGKNTK